MVAAYKGKRRSEAPPHIYSVADNAYNDMLRSKGCQTPALSPSQGAGPRVPTWAFPFLALGMGEPQGAVEIQSGPF